MTILAIELNDASIAVAQSDNASQGPRLASTRGSASRTAAMKPGGDGP